MNKVPMTITNATVPSEESSVEPTKMPDSTDSKEQEMEADLQEASEIFNSLFSTRRPKDGWAGISSGLKSVGKGTIAGVASLIAQPIAGAQENGVKVSSYDIHHCPSIIFVVSKYSYGLVAVVNQGILRGTGHRCRQRGGIAPHGCLCGGFSSRPRSRQQR